MRIILATCLSSLALFGISVQAAPLPPAAVQPTGTAISPHIELAAQGCGYGYRRTNGKINGAVGIGGGAFRRRGETYRANSCHPNAKWVYDFHYSSRRSRNSRPVAADKSVINPG